jgi:hypothetical protein
MIYDVMDINDVADQVGVKPSSIKYYWKHGRMPAADFTFNGTPGWLQDTINAWRPKKAAPTIHTHTVYVAISEEEARLAAELQDSKDDPEEWGWGPDEGTPVNWEDAPPDDGYIIGYGDDESLGVQAALEALDEEVTA